MNPGTKKGTRVWMVGRKSRNASGFHLIGAKPAGDAKSFYKVPIITVKSL